MHDIIEHYGKVIIALAGVLAALLLTAAVVTTISNKPKQLSVESNMKHRSAMLLTRHNIMQLLTCCDVILQHF